MDAVRPVSSVQAFMNEILGPIEVVHSAARYTDAPLDDADERPSLREIIQMTQGNAQPSQLLAHTSYLSPYEQMVIVDNAPLDPVIERIAERIATPTPVAANNYYVVRGLSDRVPSTQYEQTRMQQAQIQAQLNVINAGYERWSYFDQYARTANDRSTSKARDRAAECFRRLTEQFVPQPTVLKPASVARALNAKWRDLLTSELQAIRNQYMFETLRGLTPYTSAPHPDVIATQYVDALVDPFINRQLTIIGNSNYDEMPLVWSTLRDFFDSYLDNAARYLSFPPAQRPPMTAEDEQITCFLANALELYAQPQFLRVWLPAWLARNPQKPAIELALTTYVKRIVAYRQQLFEETSRTNAPSYVYFYIPMTEDDARLAYRTMIENDVALARARAVTDHETLRRAIIVYLNTPTASFIEPSWLVYNIPTNFFPLLDQFVEMSRNDIAAAHAPNGTDDADLVERLRQQQQANVDKLNEHVRLLEARLALYGVTRARMAASAPHAPSDGRERAVDTDAGRDRWSPYDISYPLSLDNSEQEIDRLVTSVARSAEEFDTKTQQERAHNIRRAIDRNYTLQLLERRRAELQYQLDVLTSPVDEVPQRIVHNVNDSRTELLVITIGLSPQLEKRILTMSESLLDPMERAAQNALTTSQFRVRWFFIPAPTHIPEIGPPPRERIVRDVRLPVGELTDTYAPFLRDVSDRSSANSSQTAQLANIRAALGRAGVYRVEVNRVDADADADEQIYRSKFKATVEVVARCMRDDKLFEPLPTGSGATRDACCWRQRPPDNEFDEYVEELVALVEHGPRAYEDLLRARTREGIGLWRLIASAASYAGIELPLPLPPWGSSAPDQLVQTTYQSRNTLEQRFTYEAIYARFRHRVGAFILYLVRSDADEYVFPPNLDQYTPDELFNYYLDNENANPAGITKLRTEAGEYGLTGAGGVMRGNDDARNRVPDWNTLEDVIELARRYVVAASLPDDTATDEFRSNNGSLVQPLNVLTIVHAEPTYVSDESLVSQLQRLAHPLAQLLMSERERLFFSNIERQFTSFRDVYRERRKREHIWARVGCGRDSAGNPGVPMNATLFQLSPSSIVSEQESLCMDAEIGRMTASQVRRELETWHDEYGAVLDMFFDTASFADYERLIKNCVRQDDFAQLMRDRTRAVTPSKPSLRSTDISRQLLERPPVGEVCCLDNGQAFDDVIPTWLGAHSAITDQPRPLVIGFTGRSSLGDGVYRSAYLYESGSQPARGNVDFNGLRNMIEAACTQYTSIVGELQRQVPVPTTDAIRSAVTNARVHAEQLALVFNYFAFAAPPLRSFYEAHRLIDEIQNGTQFAKLSFSLPEQGK